MAKKIRGMGLDIDEDFLRTLLLAYEQIIMANDDYDVEYMIRKLSEVYTTAGLKTKFLQNKIFSIWSRDRWESYRIPSGI